MRHPDAVSTFDALSEGEFREVLPDTQIEASRASRVERFILTSDKVYYELLAHRRASLSDTPIIRIEELYPFPGRQLAAELARYTNLKILDWCQEESRIQGARGFVEPQLCGPLPSCAGRILRPAYQRFITASVTLDRRHPNELNSGEAKTFPDASAGINPPDMLRVVLRQAVPKAKPTDANLSASPSPQQYRCDRAPLNVAQTAERQSPAARQPFRFA
nr:hypothetical protein [Burkholderia pseudomallei]